MRLSFPGPAVWVNASAIGSYGNRGEMGRELLLGGARVLPRRLWETGFAFAFGEIESALRHELGRA